MTITETKPVVTLPKPDGDFYQVTECLNDAERDTLKQVRTFMETEVAPVITKYWAEDSFPFELIPALRDLKIGGLGYNGYECAGGSTMLVGFVAMEMARVDSSIRHVLWRPQRLGDGLDLSGRVRSPKAKMASANGSAREDRVLWPDRAAGRAREPAAGSPQPRSAKATPGCSTGRRSGSATQPGAT